MEEHTPRPEPSVFDRMRARQAPEGIPGDDRGCMRMVMDSLILHSHPPRVVIQMYSEI